METIHCHATRSVGKVLDSGYTLAKPLLHITCEMFRVKYGNMVRYGHGNNILNTKKKGAKVTIMVYIVFL